jgi:hypothetical protein
MESTWHADILPGHGAADSLTPMGQLNLINLFDFYLAAFFLISSFRRWRQYHAVLNLLRHAPGRWPKLMALLHQQRGIIFNRATLTPVVLAFVIMTVQVIMSRLVLPEASVTIGDFARTWYTAVVFLVTVVPMLSVDAYFLIRVSEWDNEETAKYLDRAESWLSNWKSTLVRVFTFGRINPRQMVEDEVRKALGEMRRLMARNFYWMALQYLLRVLFGLTLWSTWALRR